MNAFNRAALKAYGRVGKEAAVEFADNHALVKMLFSGAVDSMCKFAAFYVIKR